MVKILLQMKVSLNRREKVPNFNLCAEWVPQIPAFAYTSVGAFETPGDASNIVVETAALVLAGGARYSRIATVLALLWVDSVAFVTWTKDVMSVIA